MGLVLLRMARERLRGDGGIRFLLWLQYASAALAALLLGGYVLSVHRWMFLCGLVALVPAAVSGLYNEISDSLPR
jgi:hypothetical protein